MDNVKKFVAECIDETFKLRKITVYSDMENKVKERIEKLHIDAPELYTSAIVKIKQIEMVE